MIVRLLLAVSLLQPLLDLDHRLQRTVQSWRRPELEGSMQVVTRVTRPGFVLAGVAVAAFVDARRGGLFGPAALLSLAATNLTVEVVKRATFRARPDGEHKASNASFPSSHAASAFAFALLLARRWRPITIPVFLLAAWIAFSRVYLNRHFTSDVIGGALLGLFWSWVALTWLERRRQARARASPQANSV